MGERVRVKKLLRSVTHGMLLMWDRGLHSYVMVQATLAQKCDYLGRVPKKVKFQVEKVLDDSSYLSWIAPDRKSKKKGATIIGVRVIEYTLDTDGEAQIYGHWAFSSLMFQVAMHSENLSFTFGQYLDAECYTSGYSQISAP